MEKQLELKDGFILNNEFNYLKKYGSAFKIKAHLRETKTVKMREEDEIEKNAVVVGRFKGNPLEKSLYMVII